MEEESGWTDLGGKGLSPIDESSGYYDQGVPGHLDLSSMDAVKLEGTVYSNEKGAKIAPLPETSEAEMRRKFGKCNLRKSLAWDSAFFTSAGVLDPDELSSMIEEAGKDGNTLTTIEEDMRRSIDSVSTLESDNLALESIEAELFKDIRASIQKSSKTFISTNPNSQPPASGGTDNQLTSSSKKVDLTCRNKVNSNAALKNQAVGMVGQGKLMKKASGNPKVRQSFAGDSTSSLPKPTKGISSSRIPSETGKSASSFGNPVKIENNCGKVTASSKASQTSKVTGLGVPRKVIPKPTSSFKLHLVGSSPAIKVHSTKYSSSLDKSGSSSSDKGKSPSISGRRKTETKLFRNSSLSDYLASSNISSSISPASSISDWSTESSSSITVNQRCDRSRTSIGTSSCKSLDSDVAPAMNMKTHATDRLSGHERKVPRFPNQTATSAAIRTLSGSASVKPSGLRLPSPKIGFFDGAKSVVPASNGSLQSQPNLPTSLPKPRSGNFGTTGSSNKANVKKILPSRRVAGLGSIKPVSQKLASSNSTQEQSKASTDIKGCPSLLSKVQNEVDGISLKAMEVQTPGQDSVKGRADPSLRTVVQGSCSDASLNDCINMNHTNKVGEYAAGQHIKYDPNSTLTSKREENGHCENQLDHFCRGGRVIRIPEVQQKEPFVSLQKEECHDNVLDSSPSKFSTTLEARANGTPFADKNIICEKEASVFLKESSA